MVIRTPRERQSLSVGPPGGSSLMAAEVRQERECALVRRDIPDLVLLGRVDKFDQDQARHDGRGGCRAGRLRWSRRGRCNRLDGRSNARRIEWRRTTDQGCCYQRNEQQSDDRHKCHSNVDPWLSSPAKSPATALWLASDSVGDDVHDPIRHRGRPLVEPVPKHARHVGAIVHAVDPPTAVVRASASSAARIARCA